MRSFPFDLPHLTSVDNSERIRERVERYEPVLFKGRLAGWPMFRDVQQCASVAEQMSLLAPHLEDSAVRFSATPARVGGHLGYSADLRTSSSARYETTFDDFKALLERSSEWGTKGTIYMQAKRVSWFARLAERLREFADCCKLPPGRANLWIGSGGQVVNLHYDDKLNFMCLLEGTKRVALFPPEVSKDLYQGPLDGPFGAPMSFVTLLQPDIDRFPRLTRALEKGRLALLSPGDVLYLPPFWWHHVESFGFNIMLNGWFNMAAPAVEEAMCIELHRGVVLFAKESPEQREHSRAILFASSKSRSTSWDSLRPELREYLEKCRAIVSQLHPHWQREINRLYDYFVFQTDGVPMATVPGEFGRMVERFTAANALRQQAPRNPL